MRGVNVGEHASKCTQTAETFPPGEQRQKFLDMAEDWTRLANSVEGLEASLSQAPANSNEPYRFGSRIRRPVLAKPALPGGKSGFFSSPPKVQLTVVSLQRTSLPAIQVTCSASGLLDGVCLAS